jgi:diaminopimelate epimerase
MFAKFLYEHGYTKKDNFTIDTKGGITTATVKVTDGKVTEVTVEMGKATFNSEEIPVAGEKRDVVSEKLTVGDKEFVVTCVSVGNPHCVLFTDKLNLAMLRKYGPLLEHHEQFPNRINVQFAKVISKDEVEILIWERGAGETTASGSSACAVAAAAVKNNITDNNVTIKMQGGSLKISVDENWNITMTGPASEVYTGTLSKEFLDGFTP